MRSKWIEDLFEEHVAPATVDQLQDPAALHLIACHYNWDGGDEVPLRLARHPELDRGTALLLYWLSDPLYEAESGAALTQPMTELINSLRSRLVAGEFQHSTIEVDLRRDLQFNRLSLHLLARDGTPTQLIETTPGAPFDERTVVQRLRANAPDAGNGPGPGDGLGSGEAPM